MRMNPSRRRFLKTTALAGVGYWAAGSTRSAWSQSPNEQIQFACIGVGGKGTSDSASAARHGNVVAICDIDERTLDKQGARFEEAERFFDYREMLDKLGDKIDAVTVSTPDHTHAVAAAKAMRMGKHCFCQKPLTHDIYEARFLGDLAREKRVITQMGNQGTADINLRMTAALIKSGALGDVSEVRVWTNRPVWPQGIERPINSPPTPPHVHWDQWIGPAPYRPYDPAYHPFKWRGFWDFGTGALGDMACHTFNMPFMALDLRNPISVEAQSSGHNHDSYPGWSEIEFAFPANASRGPIKFVWGDGGRRPSEDLLDGKTPANSGCLVIGDKAKLYSGDDYCGSAEILGVDGMQKETDEGLKPLTLPTDLEAIAKGLGKDLQDVQFERSPGHFTEFAEAIHGKREQATSNFPDYAGPLSETILLGNLAVWSGKKVLWDAENLEATNAPELASIVRREYQNGYSLEAEELATAQ